MAKHIFDLFDEHMATLFQSLNGFIVVVMVSAEVGSSGKGCH